MGREEGSFENVSLTVDANHEEWSFQIGEEHCTYRWDRRWRAPWGGLRDLERVNNVILEIKVYVILKEIYLASVSILKSWWALISADKEMSSLSARRGTMEGKSRAASLNAVVLSEWSFQQFKPLGLESKTASTSFFLASSTILRAKALEYAQPGRIVGSKRASCSYPGLSRLSVKTSKTSSSHWCIPDLMER